MQIINCSRWERNKNLLIYGLVYDEAVRKRRSQVKSITEGLQISGFLKCIKRYPDLCRSILFDSPGAALDGEIFLTALKQMEKIMTMKSRKP